MTEEAQFKAWWNDSGQRVLAFTAEGWAFAGWKGHKIHGRGLEEAPIEQSLSLEINEQPAYPEGAPCWFCGSPTHDNGKCDKCPVITGLDPNPLRANINEQTETQNNTSESK